MEDIQDLGGVSLAEVSLAVVSLAGSESSQPGYLLPC